MSDNNEQQTDPRFYVFRDAAYGDRDEAAQLLTDDPTLIDVRNSIGETALHFLVVEDDLPSVEWLLDRGADVNTRNDFGHTPLLEAAALGYLEMCAFLLERGADMEARNVSGGSVLSEASMSGQVEVVRMLLDRFSAGADIRANFGDDVTVQMAMENSAIAELLMAHGLSRNTQ